MDNFMNNLRGNASRSQAAAEQVARSVGADRFYIALRDALASLTGVAPRATSYGAKNDNSGPGNFNNVSEKDGVKITTTYSSGAADLDKLADIAAKNGGTLKLVKPSDYDKNDTASATDTTSQQSTSTDTANSSDIIEYTYKPGDTFGQVLLNLGLSDGANLWGQDGNVAYYTQQLYDQGVLDQNGNIPIGTTIKLRRRK